MEKMLELAKPHIRCYQHYGFPVSIVEGHIEDASCLFNYFIRLVYRHGFRTSIEFDIPKYKGDILEFWENEKFLNIDNICIDLYTISKKKVLEKIKKLVDIGTYVSGQWNEYYIQNKMAFKKFNYERSYLIHGYNDEKRCFYLSGYVGINKWCMTYQVDYDVFWKSLIKDRYLWLNTYAYKESKDYRKLDINKIFVEIKNYLLSKPIMNNDICGICANINYFENLKMEFNYKDGLLVIPPLYALYEHKIFMFRRIKYLHNCGILSLDREIIRKFEKVTWMYKSEITLAIKFNTVYKKELINEMIEIGLDAVVQEEKILKEIFG